MSRSHYGRIAWPNFAHQLETTKVFVATLWLLAIFATLVTAFAKPLVWQNTWLLTSLPITAGSIEIGRAHV